MSENIHYLGVKKILQLLWYLCSYFTFKAIKEDRMGGACNTHGRDEKCIQNFVWKTQREEATRKN